MAKGNIAGLFAAQFFKMYNNYSYGQIADPGNPGSNVTSHAYLVDNPVEVTLPEFSFERAVFRGGGQFLGSVTIGLADVPEIPFVFSDIDDTLIQLSGGGSSDTTTVSGFEISSLNELNPDPNDLGVFLTSKFHSRASGSDGELKYRTLYLRGQMRFSQPPLSHAGGENPSPLRGVFYPKVVSKFPNGVALGANQSLYKNKAVMLQFVTDRPIAMTTYVANGVATTFTLAYKPWKSTVTSGNTDNWTTKAGVATAASSISTSTGVVTIASAGTTGDLHHAIYQVLDSSFPVP